MEYFDLGVGLKSVVDIINTETYQWKGKEIDNKLSQVSTYALPTKRALRTKKLYQVRPSAVCIVGRSSRAVMAIKDCLAEVNNDPPLAIESFHVRKSDDLKDGAMLVPKIILVASHCPGRKLLDDSGEEGLLDDLYDEAFDSGAEVVIIYTDLPSTLYPPLQHGLYHENVARLLFPTQPLLRFLAFRHSFLTVTEHSQLNGMQRELLLDWITTSVPPSHPVYVRARSLAADCFDDQEAFWSERRTPRTTHRTTRRATESHVDAGFTSATEEHPLVDYTRSRLFDRRTLGDIFSTPRFAFRDAISRRNYGTLNESQTSGLTRSVSIEDRLALIHVTDEPNHDNKDVDDDEIFNGDDHYSYQRQFIRTAYV